MQKSHCLMSISDASGAAVSVSGNVELIIEGKNTLQSGTDHAGVEKADDNGTLTISGPGTLEAYGGHCGCRHWQWFRKRLQQYCDRKRHHHRQGR